MTSPDGKAERKLLGVDLRTRRTCCSGATQSSSRLVRNEWSPSSQVSSSSEACNLRSFSPPPQGTISKPLKPPLLRGHLPSSSTSLLVFIMVLPRSAALRGTVRSFSFRRAGTQARTTLRGVGRRTYASEHGATKSSDIPWLV